MLINSFADRMKRQSDRHDLVLGFCEMKHGHPQRYSQSLSAVLQR